MSEDRNEAGKLAGIGFLVGLGVGCLVGFASVVILTVWQEVWSSDVEDARDKIPQCAVHAPGLFTIGVPDQDALDDYFRVFTERGWQNMTTTNGDNPNEYEDTDFTMAATCPEAG
jgi:hypothetical protein